MPADLTATYRVQLHSGFTFDDAAAIAGYLASLGVSHLYTSPITQAVPGSTHGYDVVDHSRVSEDLGGRAGLERMSDALHRQGLGLIVDVVPNHMSIAHSSNGWWWDVLRSGPASRYARYFDIDWDPPEAWLRRRILVPILGDHYGRELDAGNFSIEQATDYRLRYGDRVLPLSEESVEWMSARDGGIQNTVDEAASVPDVMHEILELQHYRLAWWKTAGHELNYRRFFSINELAALRIEDDEVFRAVTGLIVELVEGGMVDGVRVDHVDGLRDPAAYLARLRSLLPDNPIFVEKILEPGEEMDERWPVDGTTGYDFLATAGALMLDSQGRSTLLGLYKDVTDDDRSVEQAARAAKLHVSTTELATDFERLTDRLVDLCEMDRRTRDHTRHDLREALREVTVAMPVYRTYVRADDLTDRDRDVIDGAVASATAARPDIDPATLSFIRSVLLAEVGGDAGADIALRWQQLSGAVTAKGIEDTFFYDHVYFAGRNEVGFGAELFSLDVARFHADNDHRQRAWPRALVTTATHDTKRGEDVRARLSVLTQLPQEWAREVESWRAMAVAHKVGDDPDGKTELTYFQTLAGAWPLDRERAVAYMIKAEREAKRRTAWTAVDEAYEESIARYVEGVLEDERFTAAVEAFVDRIASAARACTLAQTVLKLTSPGIPDIYQGTELVDLSLVDPDNRRAVDFDLRARCLSTATAADPDLSMAKLALVRVCLAVRRERAASFDRHAAYTPVGVDTDEEGRTVAFLRGDDVMVVVPRLTEHGYPQNAVRLPPGEWRDRFTDRRYSSKAQLGDLWADVPAALLTRDP